MLRLALATTVVAVVSARIEGQPSSPPPPPDIRITLDAAHERYRPRVTAAAQESLARYRQWMGRGPDSPLTIADRLDVRPGSTGVAVVIDPPWWSPPRAMEVESQVAFGVARLWFRHLRAMDDAIPLADSVSWYLQSRVVERLFDHAYRPIYTDETVRFFGGGIPWVFETLPLSRWSAGLGRAEFLQRVTRGGIGATGGRRLPPAFDPRALQGALAFGTLERHLGWPALQSALRVVAERATDGPMDRATFVDTVGAAVGQDLSWFFAQAFDPAVRFAYAVTEFSSAPGDVPCGAGPCYATHVGVTRRGDGLFTGTSHAPVGTGESGDALELRVTFENGQTASARWDGRAATRAFEFRSSSRALTAQLDPDRTLVLDLDPDAHVRLLAPRTNVPLTKWTARWVMWLQDAMLTYGLLFW